MSLCMTIASVGDPAAELTILLQEQVKDRTPDMKVALGQGVVQFICVDAPVSVYVEFNKQLLPLNHKLPHKTLRS